MSSQKRNGERGFHQDFIARIRYSNALPPPPNPPKLLDIPNTGLASGQYTTPGFASRLAREQPLNIEADAELGMPLDLVGMPGVFDGDESSIQASAQVPQVHPHDRALLRPLATLGKPKVAGTSVSFLRRTEYISNDITSTGKSSVGLFHKTAQQKLAAQRPPKRKSPEPEAGTPAYIKRKIAKGFEAAQANLKDNTRVQHPTKLRVGKNKGLRVMEAYPLLPDLNAFPDSGAFVTYKFAHPPITNKEGYDKRLLNSVLKLVPRSKEEEEVLQERLEAHQRDPENFPKPVSQTNYELYIADSFEVSEKFRSKFDLNNPNRDDDSLNVGTVREDDGRPCYGYSWMRSYLCTVENESDHNTKYSEEIAIALDKDSKTAFYYPSMQRNKLEPPRRIYSERKAEPDINGYEFTPEEPGEEFRLRLEKFRDAPRKNPDVQEDEEEDVASQDGEEYRREESEEPATNGRDYSEERREESEQDADGDEEE